MKKITISHFTLIAILITPIFFIVGRGWLHDMFGDKSSVEVPFSSDDYITQGNPEFLFTGYVGHVYTFEANDIICGDDAYQLKISVWLDQNPMTNQFQSALSLTVKVVSSLAKCEEVSGRDVYIPLGQTNSMNIGISELWNGSKYNNLLLQPMQRKTYTIVDDGALKYCFQIQIASSGLKWNPSFFKMEHLYGFCDLQFECLPVVFSQDNGFLISPVSGISPLASLKSSSIHLGRITVRRKKK